MNYSDRDREIIEHLRKHPKLIEMADKFEAELEIKAKYPYTLMVFSKRKVYVRRAKQLFDDNFHVRVNDIPAISSFRFETESDRNLFQLLTCHNYDATFVRGR